MTTVPHFSLFFQRVSRFIFLRQRVPTVVLMGIILLSLPGRTSAATIVMNGSDVIGTSSFNSGLNWTGGLPPAAGNQYQTGSNLLRTPAINTDIAFAGDALEIQTGGELRIANSSTVTVENLTLDDSSFFTLADLAGGTVSTLAGNGVTLNGTTTIRSGIQDSENVNVLTIASPLGGTGGFTTTGSVGTVILTATNGFTGGATVAGGTVFINGVVANSGVLVSSGTLAGNGVINGPVTCQPGGILQPGLGSADTSTLVVSNGLSLSGTTVCVINRASAPNASTVSGITTATLGGTLTVTNAGGDLQSGDSFTLFNASAFSGDFSAVNLPTLDFGLAWTNTLAQNGTISVFNYLSATNLVVTNLPATQIFATSATLNGQVLFSGTQTPNLWIYYGPNDGGMNAAAWSNSIAFGVESNLFSAVAADLATNTTYYFSALASNSYGVSWASPSQSFQTLAVNPFVSRLQILTYHYDNTRQGQNTNETLLTLANVNTNTFGELFSYPVDGYVYTEPLIMTNVAIPGQGIHDVVFVATEHDTVYAFDANSNTGTNGGLLWQTNLGVASLDTLNPAGRRYSGSFPYSDITPEVGATGTPVIDPATGTLYVNAFTCEVAGDVTNYVHRIHALDVTTGQERSYSPVVVAGSVPGVGVDSTNGVVTFNPAQSVQRSALTLTGGRLYVAYGGYADTDPFHGWLFSFNATNLMLETNCIFCTTPNATTATFGPNAGEGGIWQGGGGLAADTNNNLFCETGNGSFSADTEGGDYADTFLKMSTTNGLMVADYFTPFYQASLCDNDNDLGASGPILLPDSVGSAAHPHLLVGLGKDEAMYLLDRDQLASPHYQPGSDGQIVQELIAALGGMWSPPSYFNNLIYVQASAAPMQSFSIANGVINPIPTATTPVSVGIRNGGPVISANGTNNAILWVMNSAAYASSGAGVLYAYNATNIAQMLYNSSQLATRDNPGGAVKMTTPTVAGGKVYVPAEYTLSVYGVQNFLDAPAISPNGGSFVNTVNIAITDASAGVSIYYTLDGTTPTAASTLYAGPFILTSNAVVRAVAVQTGAVNSAVVSASFVNTAAPGNGSGLNGEYFANANSANPFSGSPVLVQTNPVIDFSSAANWPDAVVGSNHFTVCWTGSVQPQFTENYSFVTTAEDGVRLYINGQLLIDDWLDKTNATSATNSISLVAQQFYTIELDYYNQNTNNASVTLSWSSPSTLFGVVPQTQLYPFTNPPPSVLVTAPADSASYTASASVTISADADAPNNPVAAVSFYANNAYLGSVTNLPYALTATGLAAGNYALTAVATDASGVSSTSAVVNITVDPGSGQPYGLTTRSLAPPFYGMPTNSSGPIPALLSLTGIFSDTPDMIPTNGLIPYAPNTPFWSDGAQKTRYFSVPYDGSGLFPGMQINFSPTGQWSFPAGSVFVKTFEINTDTTNPDVKRRIETRVLVRDNNGAVYGVTYKWRPDKSDADLLSSSLQENILITNATGISTQTWTYPSPSDCLTCHTPVANYVLGVNTRQLNGNYPYASTEVTDNQLRTLNRIGLLNPAFDEGDIASYRRLSAVTNTSASLEERVRSYLDANCEQCHQPGGQGITFDARYDTAPVNQNITNFPAAFNLGYDHACIVKSQDVWRSVLLRRVNTTNPAIQMPAFRNLIDSNAVQVITDWINSLPGTPALAPAGITPNGGQYFNNVGINLVAPDTNAVIYFTLDGSLPTTNSLVYFGPFTLTSNATVTASVFLTNYDNSVATSALFFVDPLYFSTAAVETNQQFQVNFVGVPGSNYVLQATTNFATWIPLSTNTLTTNPFILFDTNAAGFPYRFYRVLQQ
jgi:uncharacterized repeat protein (TIGR03806 family)